jgi:hypothetical protein
VTFGPKGGITAAVYDPPRRGLPSLAVIFGPDGEVLAARSMPSSDHAEAFCAEMMAQFAASTGKPLQAR